MGMAESIDQLQFDTARVAIRTPAGVSQKAITFAGGVSSIVLQ